MSPFQAAVWGIVQGLTEFLPVSSSGHLVLLPWLIGWETPSLTYDVVVHFGTLAAILGYFRREILELVSAAWWILRRRGSRPDQVDLVWLIAISALPAVVLGLLMEDLLESAFGAPLAAACFLIVTGVLLMLAEWLGDRQRVLKDLRPWDALLLGLAQSLALLPGISRSGATISAGLMRGLQREAAARFSFLMVIPVVFGATLYEVTKLFGASAPAANWFTLLIGFLCACVSGYLAVSFLLDYVRSRGMRPFAIYCWAIGSVAIIAYFVS